jgi:hypothetical protein
VYTGHVAIALAVRGVRRDVPLWVLVLAAQGPDWVEVLCGGFGTRERIQLWSHAFPFVLVGAVAAAIIVRLSIRASGPAWITFAVYLSHPLADLVTGYKPLWLGGPSVGLQFIDRPVPDFIVQGSLCLLGWLLYRRSLPPHVRRRVIVAAPLVTLLAVQAASDLVVLARRRATDGRLRTDDGRRTTDDDDRRRTTGDGRRATVGASSRADRRGIFIVPVESSLSGR